MLKSWGIPCAERRISIAELMEATENGRLDEAFGSGTAAVISPIGQLTYMDKSFIINGGKTGPTAQRLYDALTGIQWGKLPDTFGWTVEV
jgi:branched-chain amino acid aminotransferase